MAHPTCTATVRYFAYLYMLLSKTEVWKVREFVENPGQNPTNSVFRVLVGQILGNPWLIFEVVIQRCQVGSTDVHVVGRSVQRFDDYEGYIYIQGIYILFV